MATIFHYGSKNTVIEHHQKEAFIQESIHKIITKQGSAPKRVLLLPPDMTRLHSDAGTLTQIVYKQLSAQAYIDIMPAIGTHFPMTEQEIKTIRNSLEIMGKRSQALAQMFYNRLFRLDPSLRRMFRTDIDVQAEKLMAVLAVLIGSLEQFDTLRPTLRYMGSRHAEYGVLPEHYKTSVRRCWGRWKKLQAQGSTRP